ncbi:hypothetical protein GIB67_023167, partial [Kingdonia uniflora]
MTFQSSSKYKNSLDENTIYYGILTDIIQLEYRKVLDTIVRRMTHYNPFDNLQSSGDDSNTVDTGNNSSSNASSKKKRGLTREKFLYMFMLYLFILALKVKEQKKSGETNIAVHSDRISMPITRHKLVEERGVTDEEIGRVEVYIPAHTKKDKTIQYPDLLMYYYLSIYSYIHIYANLAKRGKVEPGYGADISISLVEKVGHIVNENEELRSNNNELKFATERLMIQRTLSTGGLGIPVYDFSGYGHHPKARLDTVQFKFGFTEIPRLIDSAIHRRARKLEEYLHAMTRACLAGRAIKLCPSLN